MTFRFLFPAPGRRRLTLRGTVIVCGVIVGLGSIAMTARLGLREPFTRTAATSTTAPPVAQSEVLENWQPVPEIAAASPTNDALPDYKDRGTIRPAASSVPPIDWKRAPRRGENMSEADERSRFVRDTPSGSIPETELAGVDNAHWESLASPNESIPLWPPTPHSNSEPAHLAEPNSPQPVPHVDKPDSDFEKGRANRVRTAAILLLANARRDLSEGKLLDAWQKGHAAAGLDAVYEALDDHPNLLLSEIEQKLHTARTAGSTREQQFAFPSTAPSRVATQVNAEVAVKPLAFQTATGTLRVRFDLAPWDEILQQFAHETGTALHAENFPEGTLTYADAKEYTAPEMLNLLNGFLFARRYALVRSNGQLVLVNSDRGIPADLVPATSLESIESCGENELIRIQMSAQGRTAEEAARNIAPFLGPFGRVAAGDLPDTILIADTGRNIRRIHYILSREVADRAKPVEGSLESPAETPSDAESTDEAERPLSEEPTESSRGAELTGEVTRFVPRIRPGDVERTSFEHASRSQVPASKGQVDRDDRRKTSRPSAPRATGAPVIEPRIVPIRPKRSAS